MSMSLFLGVSSVGLPRRRPGLRELRPTQPHLFHTPRFLAEK